MRKSMATDTPAPHRRSLYERGPASLKRQYQGADGFPALRGAGLIEAALARGGRKRCACLVG